MGKLFITIILGVFLAGSFLYFKFKPSESEFTLEIGDRGWYYDETQKKWNCLIITSDGIFLNGEYLAKGKLKLVNK